MNDFSLRVSYEIAELELTSKLTELKSIYQEAEQFRAAESQRQDRMNLHQRMQYNPVQFLEKFENRRVSILSRLDLVFQKIFVSDGIKGRFMLEKSDIGLRDFEHHRQLREAEKYSTVAFCQTSKGIVNSLECILEGLKEFQRLSHIPETCPSSPTDKIASTGKRFRVALSFPGEKREFVSNVANYLAKHLQVSSILYDLWHQAELARPGLDAYFLNLYRNESDLVVPFLCSDYNQKNWCGLELRAIREMILEKQLDGIMPLRFDDAQIEGFNKVDGYIDLRKVDEQQTASLIIERLSINDRILKKSLETA
ncbi:MAG: TIR domain-containing protein [Candidatus Sumerlaeota bacterium]